VVQDVNKVGEKVYARKKSSTFILNSPQVTTKLQYIEDSEPVVDGGVSFTFFATSFSYILVDSTLATRRNGEQNFHVYTLLAPPTTWRQR